MSSKGPQEKNNSPWKRVWDICAETMWTFGRQNLPDECGRAREGTDEESRSEKVKELWLALPPQCWKRWYDSRFSLENKVSRLSGMKQEGWNHAVKTLQT